MLFVQAPSWGMYEARLLKQSLTGQTVLFNLGRHDQVSDGDYAIILKQIRDLKSRDLRLVPVAKARNIKINSDSSIWILYNIYDPELMVAGDKFLILAESDVLRGRRDPRFGRITSISPRGYEKENTLNALSDDKDRVAKLKNKYQETSVTHEKESRSDADGELVDVERWDEIKNLRHQTALYKSPDQKEFQKTLRLATFEKVVTGYLKKINDPNFSYEKFYEEQMKVAGSNENRQRPVSESEYAEFIHKESEKKTADAKLYRALLEKGDSWSEDYSDEELGQILSNVSVLQEKERRYYQQSKSFRYTATVQYGVSFSDPQNGSDTYHRDSRYSLDLNFEATPFLKQPTLERFTLNASVRTHKSAFEAGGYNSSLDEVSFTGGVNWYPIYAAYEYQAPILFIGTFVRTGFATAKVPTKSEKANYSVTSFPGFLVGIRYNFRNRIGTRLVASMETLQLDRYENSKVATVLPESTTLFDGKLGIGMTYSF